MDKEPASRNRHPARFKEFPGGTAYLARIVFVPDVPLRRVESVRNKTVRVGDRDLPLGTGFEENFLRRFGA